MTSGEGAGKRAWLSAASLAVAVALPVGCQRTAPEDFPPPRDASGLTPPPSHPGAPPGDAAAFVPAPSSVVSAAAVVAGRCVKPTPAQAPPSELDGPAPGCPVDPEDGSPKVPVVRVSFADVAGLAVDAELVRSEHDTMRGLMYRRSMPADHGMLFDLRVRDEHKFWMHNTCISLDLLYIDDDGLIVGIAENAPTLSDDTIGVGCPSRWVLEVNAGWSRRHGVRAGQRLNLPGGV
jgi:uncharacterized membrane protein (UPF0127 family)